MSTGQLPPGWVVVFDAANQQYYLDTNTGNSQWGFPTAPTLSPPSFIAQAQPTTAQHLQCPHHNQYHQGGPFQQIDTGNTDATALQAIGIVDPPYYEHPNNQSHLSRPTQNSVALAAIAANVELARIDPSTASFAILANHSILAADKITQIQQTALNGIISMGLAALNNSRGPSVNMCSTNIAPEMYQIVHLHMHNHTPDGVPPDLEAGTWKQC